MQTLTPPVPLIELKDMRLSALYPPAARVSLYAQNAVKLKVDATDAPRRLFHVQMTMPAKPGAMTLLYPEWIPGEHGPTGPIANLVGLKIQGGGKTIPWKRDSVNMFAFHLDVPGRRDLARRGLRFHLAAGIGGLLLRRVGHQRTGRAQLESAAALSRGRAARRLSVPGHAEGARRLALRHRAAHPARERQRDRVSARQPDHDDRFAGLHRRALSHHRPRHRAGHSALPARGRR